MVAPAKTAVFNGIELLDVYVQVQISLGQPAFTVAAVPNKSVSEPRKRVRPALYANGVAPPNNRITLNLSPADLLKEGSHFDLPIKLGLLAIIGVVPENRIPPPGCITGCSGQRARWRRI